MAKGIKSWDDVTIDAWRGLYEKAGSPTRDDLDRLMILAREATPRPWKAEGRAVTSSSGSVLLRSNLDDYGYDNDESDNAFIVAARDSVPVLIAEVRRLRSALAAAESTRTNARQPEPTAPTRRDRHPHEASEACCPRCINVPPTPEG